MLKPESPTPASERTVLIVDDSPIDRAIIGRLLSRVDNPFRLLEVDKVSLALQRFREVRPDVVLLDQHLPDGNGTDLLSVLRQDLNGEESTAFVMLTTSSSPETGLEAMRRGAHDFLVKGKISAAELQKTLDNALGKIRMVREVGRQRRMLLEKNETLEAELAARREAERLLRHSEALAQSILDASGDCIAILDPDACLISMNRPGLDLLEIDDLSAFCGLDWLDFWNGNEDFRAALESARNGGEGRFQGICATARGLPKSWTVLVKGIAAPDEKLATIVVISRDVTQERIDEKALRDALAAADSANRAKDTFFAALSHELRTPLNPVLLIASEWEKDASLSPEVRSDFESIRKNIEIESRLIDDLLDVTRIGSGKLSLKIARTDLNDPLAETCQLLKSDFAEKGLHLLLRATPGYAWVDADPVRLKQVFWNIIKNAIRFTPRGGSISIATELIPPDRVRVVISDTGAGLDADDLERIFSAFEQGRRGKAAGGLGLGLAIARGLTDLHGGRISAESAGLGRGATFRIEFPLGQLAEEIRQSAPIPRSPPFEVTGSHILIVEDHEATRHTMSRLLARRGHIVMSAGTIAEALEIATSFPTEILLTDVGLPDGSGRALMSALRKRRPQCRGIALSGYGTDDDVKLSNQTGFDSHLVKPIEIQELEFAIRNIAFKLRNP